MFHNEFILIREELANRSYLKEVSGENRIAPN